MAIFSPPARSQTLRKAIYSHKNNLISIVNATFYREHPSADHLDSTSNPPLFPKLNFRLPAATPSPSEESSARESPHWAIISPSDGTTFLEILRGSYLCIPPNSRKFPYLSSEAIDRKDHRLRVPSRAIQYVGFNGGKGQASSGTIRGAYLSARYESRREETDWTVLQYLRGETELNPNEEASAERHIDETLLRKVMSDLRLHKLADMPVSNLSNGQTRRARIAKALMGKPELLLLDEPFMGLDPPTLMTLSPMLRDLAYNASPLLLLALRPQDPIPDWITHLIILGQNHTVALQGSKAQVLFALDRWHGVASKSTSNSYNLQPIPQAFGELMTQRYGPPPLGVGDVLTENGIGQYGPFQKWRDMKLLSHYLYEDGTIKIEKVFKSRKPYILDAIAKRPGDRTIKDLAALVTTLPIKFGKPEFTNGNPILGDLNDKRNGPPSTETTPGNIAQHDTSIQSTSSQQSIGEPLIELTSVVVRYGSKTVLGHPPAQPGYSTPGLNLTIRQGTRLALLGPNGSGKTTLLSLLTSDHPQSYSLPIQFFGRSRLPSPGQAGLSLWEIQSRIGHSSPEIHAFFPKYLTIRRVLESAWAETYAGKPNLNPEREALIDTFLRWWAPELSQDGAATLGEGLEWAVDKAQHSFGVLPFSSQRLLLLLRALIKQPEIVILDEAFSGLPGETRDKAMRWLEYGENSLDANFGTSTSANFNGSSTTSESAQAIGETRFPGLKPTQALVVVSHVKEEIPGVVNEWLRLPGEEEVSEANRSIEGGFVAKGGLSTHEGWNRVWAL